MRTIYEYSEALTADIAWRKKEISQFKLEAKSQKSGIPIPTLVRAGIPIVYAHYEGFTKCCATNYCAFLEEQREKTLHLSSFAIAQAYKSQLDLAAQSSSTHLFAEFIDTIFMNKIQKSFPINSSINTESNLSSSVLEKMYKSFGIDYSRYTIADKAFIDTQVLEKRNKIAHGEKCNVDKDDFVRICNGIEELLERICTDFTNHVTLKAHIKTPKRSF